MLELNNLIGFLIGAIIAVAVPPLAYAVWQLIKAQEAQVKARLTTEQLAQIKSLTVVAAQYAEQSGLSKQIENTGKALKAAAINRLQELANEHNIPISVAEAEAQLEAAILQGLHKKPPSISPSAPTPPPPELSLPPEKPLSGFPGNSFQ